MHSSTPFSFYFCQYTKKNNCLGRGIASGDKRGFHGTLKSQYSGSEENKIFFSCVYFTCTNPKIHCAASFYLIPGFCILNKMLHREVFWATAYGFQAL